MTIAVEIPEELKEEVEKYKIDVEGVVRKAKAREQDRELGEEWEKTEPTLDIA